VGGGGGLWNGEPSGKKDESIQKKHEKLENKARRRKGEINGRGGEVGGRVGKSCFVGISVSVGKTSRKERGGDLKRFRCGCWPPKPLIERE